MTQKLPRTVKKKLEASLENLTPRQAGRLFLIYSGEYDKNPTAPSFWEYPPIVDLMNAWKRRTEAAKAKGGEVERQGVALHNGFLTLTEIFMESNRFADSDLWRLYLLATTTESRLNILLLQDFQSEIARYTIGNFTEDIPRPLSWEEYNRAVVWYEENEPIELGDLANRMTGAWARKQGYKTLEVPQEFLEANSEPTNMIGDHKFYAATEDLRRKWVESTGEKTILSNYFAGDHDRLEAWVKYGGLPEFNDSEFEQKADEIFDRMVEMIKSGELEGGLSFGLINQWGAIPARDWKETLDLKGKLPAWAALRSVWDGWLYEQGIFKSDELLFLSETPDPLEKYYDIDGTLEGDRLTVTAKKFYLDCRKKTWGAGLIDPKKVDFANLGRFLCIFANPLLGYYAPDLGWVEVEPFGEAEGDDVFLGTEETRMKPDWYTTLKGLRQKAGDLNIDPETDDFEFNAIREFYYPTNEPEEKRTKIARLFRQMDTLRVSHRPFTYREKNKPDLPSFLGLKFYTPLEEAIREIGEAFDMVETFKRTYDILSQEFFEGMSILSTRNQERLRNVEETLKNSEDRLNEWLQILGSEVWGLDISSLRLVKKGAKEEEAKLLAGFVIIMADDDHDNPKRPAWLEEGETFEQITKRLTGLDYPALKKKARKMGG